MPAFVANQKAGEASSAAIGCWVSPSEIGGENGMEAPKAAQKVGATSLAAVDAGSPPEKIFE